MKIGVLTTSFPRWEGDPAGLFVLGFARALARRGHEVEVLAPEPASPAPMPRHDGVQLRWVPYLRPRALQRTFYGAGVPDNLRRDPSAWLGLLPYSAALARATRRARGQWDALVSHWALPCALAAGHARGARPHLAVLHSADLHLLARLPGAGAIARHIARGASQLLFVSPQHRSRFLSLLPPVERAQVGGRSHVSPMGVDGPEEPGESRRALRSRLGLERFTALAIARLVPIKGLDDAIRAVGGRADVELVIAGEGPEHARLVRLAQAERAMVRFVGRVHGRHKRDLLAAADAFVVPSIRLRSGRSEGVPAALLEAMVAGLPVVATRVGGIPSVVGDGRSGLLVAQRSPEALRRALGALRDDRRLRRRLARGGRARGRRYLWSEIAPRLEALITSDCPG